jgi:hypothetical protein
MEEYPEERSFQYEINHQEIGPEERIFVIRANPGRSRPVKWQREEIPTPVEGGAYVDPGVLRATVGSC